MLPKKKFRSCKPKKRKFTGSKYTRQKNLELKEALVEQESIEKSDESDLDETDPLHLLEKEPLHALLGKLHELSSKKFETIETSSSDDDSAAVQGFCFMDMSVLGLIFRLLLCPLCKKNHVS